MNADAGQRRSAPDGYKRKRSSTSGTLSTSSGGSHDDLFTPFSDGTENTPASLHSSASEPSSNEPKGRTFPVKSIVRVDSLSSNQSNEPAPLSTPPVTSSVTNHIVESLSSMESTAASTSSNSTVTALSDESAVNSPGEPTIETNVPTDQAASDDSAAHDGSSTKRLRYETLPSGGSSSPEGLPSIPITDTIDESLVTPRFQHILTEEGHFVVTGRGAEIVRCEDEPIRTPGAIQAFGILLTLKEEEPDRFVVRHASENTEKFLGYTPQHLFNLVSFTDILSEEQQDTLLSRIEFVRNDEDTLKLSGPDVFNISVTSPDGKRVKLWCAIHISPSCPDLLVCEFEREDDPDYPIFLESKTDVQRRRDTVKVMLTEDGVVRDTQILSKPFKVPYRAQVGRSDTSPMEIFDLLGQVQDRLSETTSMTDLARVVVAIVKEITRYQRVMVYQFDSAYNGKVAAELVDDGYSEDFYYGLHFPASDIPPQARELYKVNKLRLLYDRDLPTARIVCRSKTDLEIPMDMTHCYLRAMSPIHSKYLANMGVRSSMSLSLKVFGQLWGLVSCHASGSTGMRPPFPVRKTCTLIANVASRNIERLSNETSLQAQKLLNTRLIDSKNVSGHLIASEDELLEMFEADFGVISILGETKTLGRRSQCQESLAMLEYMRVKKPSKVIASHDISADFPDLQYDPGFDYLGGLLYVPLSDNGESFIILFRKAQAEEVKWGGNPYENKHGGPAGALEPRTSFKMWLEVVTGRSREWTVDQIELATVLCVVYGKFIRVWRQKEPSTHSSRLTQLLLANSAHQVRTPLNAIINYLEIALEGSLDGEMRDNLAQSHSASKSLVYVINDLLDLTKIEEGLALKKEEVFALAPCIHHATDPFTADAKRKGLHYDIEIHSELPKLVRGDQARVRQAIANLVANAFQNTSSGFVHVTAYLAEPGDDERMRVEIAVQDSGVGMSSEDLDYLFHDLEQVGDAESDHEGVSKQRPGRKLGLGLAVVARIVRNMDGLLRVKSELGQGSYFVLQFPFDIPDEAMLTSADITPKTQATLPAPQPGVFPRPASDAGGEITLVPRANSPSRMNRRVTDDGSQAGELQGEAAPADNASPREVKSKSRGLPDGITPITGARAPEIEVSGPMIDKAEEGEAAKPPLPTAAAPVLVVSEANPETSDAQTRLQVLIAEDDPINVMVLKKRLSKLGHEVHHAVNGEDCATVYRQRPHTFDVVLMDMQMPIMDGLMSTKTIRACEHNLSHEALSRLARRNGQVPIFAVSASLVEEDRCLYEDAGFDGWIPKPIDFGRLRTIMMGITDDEARATCAYAPGSWELGGWFQGARKELK